MGLEWLGSALTPQNGTQGQSPLDVNALNQQISQSQGNLGTLNANQMALAQALQAQANGQGPNPAQNMLNQATTQNIQQNSGLIASQKGINPALATRLAAQNAATTGQQAAGQAATMGAQQQLGAQQNLGNLYSSMAGQNLQNINTSGTLANNASLGSQQITAGATAQNAAGNQNTISGLGGALTGMAASFFNKGGMVQKLSDGGAVDDGSMNNWLSSMQPQTASQAPIGAPAQQALGQSASQQIANSILAAGGVHAYPTGMNLKLGVPSGGGGAGGQQAMAGGPMDATGMDLGESGALLGLAANKGAIIPSHLHPIASIYHGYQAPKTKQLKSAGGKVPGKAMVAGDSPINDTVPTRLSPGEVVIPRSVMESKDPAAEAAKFVASKLKQDKKYSQGGSKEDFKAALKKAIGSRKAA